MHRESLCESCAWMKEVRTPKGSRFLLCLLSRSDQRFARYPPQPLLRCDGYQPRADEDPQQDEPRPGEEPAG